MGLYMYMFVFVQIFDGWLGAAGLCARVHARTGPRDHAAELRALRMKCGSLYVFLTCSRCCRDAVDCRLSTVDPCAGAGAGTAHCALPLRGAIIIACVVSTVV